jgi:APA family basic amino acid/polyamine antiporter
LAAFVLVSAGVLVMRRTQPNMQRGFKTPLVPFVPIMGVIVCGAMMYGLDVRTWEGFLSWTAVGLIVYFLYSRYHSVARKEMTSKTMPVKN